MTKTTETGHARNVANFEQLIIVCQALGTAYNPSKPSLRIPELQLLLAEAKTALRDTRDRIAGYNDAVNERRNLYATLRPLSTRLLNALAMTDAKIETINDAKGYNRKIQGKRAQIKAPVITDTTETDSVQAKTISASQQSYVQLNEHFGRFISLLALESKYQPNEPELQVHELRNLYDEMEAKCTAVMTAYTAIRFCRSNRNRVIYNDEKSIINTVEDIKQYIKATCGVKSDAYKDATELKFIIIGQ